MGGEPAQSQRLSSPLFQRGRDLSVSLSHSWYQSLPSKEKWDLHLVLHIFVFLHVEGKGSLWVFPLSGLIIDPKHSENGGSLYSPPRSKEYFGNKMCCFVMCYPKNSPLCLFAQLQKNPKPGWTHIHFFMEVSSQMVSQKVFRLWTKYHGSALYTFLPVCVSKGSYQTC